MDPDERGMGSREAATGTIWSPKATTAVVGAAVDGGAHGNNARRHKGAREDVLPDQVLTVNTQGRSAGPEEVGGDGIELKRGGQSWGRRARSAKFAAPQQEMLELEEEGD